MFKRILVPVDGSLRAERAIPVAARLARASGGSVILVRVATIPIDYGLYMADLKLAVTESVAVDVDAANALIRVADNGEDAEGAGVFGGCDIIAMATHGRGGLQRWAMGSVTERVLGATQLPLLIVRPQEVETGQEVHDEEFAEAGIGGIHIGSSLF